MTTRSDTIPEMDLRIIAPRHTFDKSYDPIDGELGFDQTHLTEILEEILSLVDSLGMVLEDRRRVLEACRRCREKRIVIVHGTDTMPETTRLIGREGLAKTIIVTGAMVPYAVTRSDALFNLGSDERPPSLLE